MNNLLYSRSKYGRCCSVPQCQFRSGTNSLSKVKVFCFPQDGERRLAWVLAIRRKNWWPVTKSVVCSKHFIKGSPSSDPEHPDWVPSIFPFKRRSGKIEERRLERYERLRERRKATGKGQRGGKREGAGRPKGTRTSADRSREYRQRTKENRELLIQNIYNVDDPGVSSKKKKPKPKKLVDSESTSTDEHCEDFPIDSSSDLELDDQVPPPAITPVAVPHSRLIPKSEFVFVGKRSVDVNYFMSGLRHVNKHHKSLPCGISDMIICEEATKGDLHGIVFRCKMCLMMNTVWLEDPYKVAVDKVKQQAAKVAAEEQLRNELYSMSGIKDFLVTKPRILPKVPISRKPQLNLPGQSNVSFVGQSQTPVILQSHVPLVGYPQVASMQQAFLPGTGVRPTGEGTSSSFTNPPLVDIKFCVEEPVKPVITSTKSIAAPAGRRASKRIALSPSGISRRHASFLKSAAALANTAPEKITVTPDVLPRSHTGSPSAPGRIIFAQNPFPGAQILQTQSVQSGVGTAAPRTILLTPEDLQKIFSAQSSLPGQGTAAKTQGIFLAPPGIQKTLQLPSAQSGPETTAKEVSRSILLPPNVFVPLSQSAGFGTSATATLPETITSDISIPDVLPVDLNLVKKEKNLTESVEFGGSGDATTVPEMITSDIASAEASSVNLSLVKKEIEES